MEQKPAESATPISCDCDTKIQLKGDGRFLSLCLRCGRLVADIDGLKAEHKFDEIEAVGDLLSWAVGKYFER